MAACFRRGTCRFGERVAVFFFSALLLSLLPQSNARGQFGWLDAPLGPGGVSLELGAGSVSANGISLETDDRSGAYGWYGPLGYERPGDPEGFYPYATSNLLPDAGNGFVGWRAIAPAYRADLLIPGNSTHFAIEYKDNLLSPRLDPRRPKGDGPSVKIGERQLGQLEAHRDHEWKRKVFAIPSNAVREPDGRYRIQLGGGDFGQNEFYGTALFSRIIAAQGPIPERPAVNGFWPATTPLMTDGQWYDRAGRPYVPIIGDAPFENADVNQWDAIPLMGINTQISHGGAEGNGNRGWSSPPLPWTDPVRGEMLQMGIGLNMERATALGVQVTPLMYTDTWQSYIRELGKPGTTNDFGGPGFRELYNGTWRGVMRVWEKALTDYVKDNPNVPFIYLKDEWDHEDEFWGSLEEQVVEMRAAANRIAPGVPTTVLAMGWKPLMLQASYDLADVVWSDRYPYFDENRNLSLERVAEVAEWAEEMRRVSNGRAFMNVLPLSMVGNATDPSTWISADFLRPGVYMSLVHGGRGMWYFGDPAGMNFAPARDYYASLKPLNDEITALSDIIHASAEELGRTIATTRLGGNFFPLTYRREGDGVSLADGVSTAYRESDTRRVLMTVNEWDEARHDVRLQVSHVRQGDEITVLFEGRTIIADQDGSFVDHFDPFERHVYLVTRIGLLCDLDGDGRADAADAAMMFANWGGSGDGDCNADGVIDAADAGILFGEWTSDTHPVPEPSTAAHFGLGMILLVTRVSFRQIRRTSG